MPLNVPMAILKHTLPLRHATPDSSSLPSTIPHSSSPCHSPVTTSTNPNKPLPKINFAKRARSSSPVQDENEECQAETVLTSTSINPFATPHPNKRTNKNENDMDKQAGTPLLAPTPPLPPSSVPSTNSRLALQTPLNVMELKKGKHEIVGILRKKMVFSKRPEPVVKLDTESEEE